MKKTTTTTKPALIIYLNVCILCVLFVVLALVCVWFDFDDLFLLIPPIVFPKRMKKNLFELRNISIRSNTNLLIFLGRM